MKEDQYDDWMEHRQRLQDLEEVQHTFPVRGYIEFLITSNDDLPQYLKDKGLWNKWKIQRDKMDPEMDELIAIGSYCFEYWDWDKYKKHYMNKKIDAWKNDKNQITSYKDEIEAIRKQVKKNSSTLSNIETKVEALFNRILG